MKTICDANGEVMADKNARYMHFMVRHGDSPLGWISPAEMTDAGPCGGSYVLPISKNGRFQKQYKVDVARYLGQGELSAIQTVDVLTETIESRSLFVVQVGSQSISFQERIGASEETRLGYIGRLENPDFTSTLVEIEPVPSDSLDRLLNETGYVLIGCYPGSHYGGIDQQMELGPDDRLDSPIRPPQESSGTGQVDEEDE